MALIGIVLVALNLRTAVAAISPIIGAINVDVPLGSVALGVIGMIPPIAFSLSGVFGASGARRLGLERFTVLAIMLMIVGHVIRSVSGSFLELFVGSVLALTGAGIGNILLPPLVKRYCPDRIGLVTTIYVTLLAVSTTIPAAVAAPIAESGGWRLSLGIWSIIALASLVPWLAVLMQHRRERTALLAGNEAPEMPQPSHQLAGRIWHSRVAWTITFVFAVSSFQAYAVFAWLPQLLMQTAHAGTIEAGSLLALFALLGLPAALVVPVLTTRIKNVGWLLQTGCAFFIVGYLGLLVVPTVATWLWVVLIGSGELLFPACLTLINLRTHSPQGSVALSGFVQGVGYALGALGPLLVGILHDITGGWTGALILLTLAAVACTIAATRLRKPIYVEDDVRRG